MSWFSTGIVLVMFVLGIGGSIITYKLGRATGKLEALKEYLDSGIPEMLRKR